jgi:class 3 adenylate cyclase
MREEDLYELVRIGAISFEDVEKQLALYNDRQSKLGFFLFESITRRVILIILLMIFIVPFFLSHTINHVNSYILNIFQDLNLHSGEIPSTVISQTIDETKRFLNYGYRDDYLLYLEMNPYSPNQPIINDPSKLNRLPDYVLHSLFVNQYSNTTDLTYSSLRLGKEEASYNIALTIFIGLTLIIGSFYLIVGAHRLIIEPIDRMLNLVEAVAKNPLRPYSFENKYNEGTGEYEIQLLQSTITKITSLLRVGFGEAGAGIISANLTTKQNSTSINPLLPGVRVYAIFGFCDILQFEDINQRLETDVLTFVNTIAEIVHSRVHSWNGQCNKNLGNAFVVVWRIGDEETIMNLLYRNNLNGINHHANHHKGVGSNHNNPNATPKSRQSIQLNNAHDNHNVSSSYGAENPNSSRIMVGTHNRSGSTSSSATNARSIAKLASGVLRGFSTQSSNIHHNHNASAHSLNDISNHNHSTTIDDETTNTNPNHHRQRKGHVIDLRRVPGVDVLADKALISYLKIIAEINRSKEILKYRYEPRLTLNGSEEFKVRMGFGLHAGWAIEGAVGSLQKVDATYLSPHVNLAARLETASRQYGVPLLFSQKFYDILSVYGQEYCRKLDVVMVKGSQIPIAIYTWDTLQDQDFFLEDRKAKRRSSMASLHTIMSNLESVVEENVSLTTNNGERTGVGIGRRLSSLVSSNSSTNTPHTAGMYTNSTTATSRKFSLKGNEANNSVASVLTTAQAAMAAAAAAGITMGGQLSSSNLNSGNSNATNTLPQPTFPILSAREGFTSNFPPSIQSKFTPIFYTANDDTMDTFTNDYDLLQLRSHIREDFRAMFRDGVNAYLAGDWPLAKIYFEKANKMIRTTAPMLKGDGPSLTLLEYMAKFDYQCPMHWKGYRQLTDK